LGTWQCAKNKDVTLDDTQKQRCVSRIEELRSGACHQISAGAWDKLQKCMGCEGPRLLTDEVQTVIPIRVNANANPADVSADMRENLLGLEPKKKRKKPKATQKAILTLRLRVLFGRRETAARKALESGDPKQAMEACRDALDMARVAMDLSLYGMPRVLRAELERELKA
jgi:hypothetical protein